MYMAESPSHLVARGPTGSGAKYPVAEIWTLFAVAVCATVLRMYSRLSVVGFRNLRADDLLVWVGIVRSCLASLRRGAAC
jgi:hypothetical protein